MNALERLTDLQAKQSGLLQRAVGTASAVARRRGLGSASGAFGGPLFGDHTGVLLSSLLGDSRG